MSIGKNSAGLVQTVGHLLLNEVLPKGYSIDKPMTKKDVSNMMTDLAKNDPHTYVKTIGNFKKIGDAITTDVGITVGLDDIEPDYATRDRILEPALQKIRATRDINKRRKLIEQTQQKLLEVTKKHPGQMTAMALSGARGKPAQLMRSVTSPVAVVDETKETVPWLISKSYAEGLKQPDAWVALEEARRNVVEANTSVSVPGELGKILVGNMADQIVTMSDCGTKNGIMVSTDNSVDLVDRYLADSGDLITPQRLKMLRGRVKVRSTMTCEAPSGVCQKCYGLNTSGNNPAIGSNVGMIAAQAMGEPLTQMVLSAKHATRTATSEKQTLSGLAGFKQFTEIPQNFINKAILADAVGKITKIERAPQGGNYVFVDKNKHYVPPNLKVLVNKGSQVDYGDVLSEGIPKPDELIKYKGLGAGRKYFVDSMHDIYQKAGVDIDKRHVELLAKTDLNYVRILDKDSASLGVRKGDVVDYNQFRRLIAENTKNKPVDAAIGETLGANALHYTVGTRITKSVADELKQNGIKDVLVSSRVPLHEPIMKPISRSPLLNPDMLARLGHRNLKQVLIEGAAFGDASNIRGTHPIPAFVYGEDFGKGPQGLY